MFLAILKNIIEIIINRYETLFNTMSTMELVATDRSYAKWLYTNTLDKKIKEELKQLLKIK